MPVYGLLRPVRGGLAKFPVTHYNMNMRSDLS
jgi:hypothetical protein